MNDAEYIAAIAEFYKDGPSPEFRAHYERLSHISAALAAAPAQTISKDERALRRLLCAKYEHLPYMDDGEAHGQTLDWLRASVEEIETRIREINIESFAAQVGTQAAIGEEMGTDAQEATAWRLTVENLERENAVLRDALLQGARAVEGLKRECGMDPESSQAIRNSEYMGISYAMRAALATQAQAGAVPLTDIRKVALDLYTPPFRHEHGYIRDANNQMVADDAGSKGSGLIASRIRGWGRIQYLDKPEQRAAALQDEVAEMVAEALNTYWAAHGIKGGQHG